MASSAVTEMVFLIAGILLAGSLVVIVGGVSNDLSGGLDARGAGVARSLRTDVAIVNDPFQMNSDDLVLYVKNTGTANVRVTLLTVLLDGRVYTNATFDVLGSDDDDTIRPGEVAQVAVAGIVPTGDHRARVVTESGIAAEIEFRRS
ncbi:MAG TPA: hypothetical protein VM681_08550 [Candidatus Thermoplasmatota archaeon]|nr:hypothetical protein [Candidatus Thermoplasmatota archaeon]